MTAKKKPASKSTKPSTPAHGRSRRKIQKARKQAAASPARKPAHKAREDLVRVELTEKGMRATDDQVSPQVPADELLRRSDAVRAAAADGSFEIIDGADDPSLRERVLGGGRTSNIITGLLILAVLAVGWSVLA